MIKILGRIFIIFSVMSTVHLLDIPFISDIQDMIGLAHDIGDIAAGNVPLKGFFVKTVNPINVIMDTVNQLVDQVTNLGNELNGKLDSVLNAVLVRVPLEGKIDVEMKEIVNYMSKVDEKYVDFEIFAEFADEFVESTVRDHIKFVIGTNTGELQDLLHSMLLIIVPPKSALQRASLLENIKQLRNISDTKELCDLDLSFQYRLYKIYNIFMITELKAFIMTQFAYKHLGELEGVVYALELKKAQVKYIMRACQYQIEIKKIMQGASREVYRCAPNKFVNDETYVEFKKLFTSYVINQVQMGDCSGSCSDSVSYSHEKYYNEEIPTGIHETEIQSYSIISPCQGTLRDCEWIGGQVDICENPKDSEQRYQYVRSRSNGYYGGWTNCDGATYKSVYSFMKNHRDCAVCFCTCFEDRAETNAFRIISLRPQLSNIEENKVMSNFRFVLKNEMIHIQIEEAPLLPVGVLNTNYTDWVPLEDFVYFPNVTDEGAFMLQNGDGYSELTRDVDYSTIKYDRRRFNLDEISAGAGYVVTGIRWNLEDQDNKDNSPYQLEIHVTPFNFTSGELTPTDDNPSIWLTPKTQPNLPVEYTRTRVELTTGRNAKYDNPGTFTPIPAKNKYIDLRVSDSHDVYQSTIPFFDARPVVTVHNLAYDGVGSMLYHSDEYASFIGLKVMTIDMTLYVNPNLKGSQLKYYKKLYREPLRHNPLSVT